MKFKIIYLAWAWMILVGVLLITPGGVFCIACGRVANVAGYIGDPAVMVLGLGSIVLGVVGLVGAFRGGGGAR